MAEKESTEEADFIDNHLQTTEQKQVALINCNVALFRKMMRISFRASLVRLCVFVAVIVFEEQLLITNWDQGMADSWSIVFFVIACMMDFLSVINDTTLLKFLAKDEENLEKVKEDLQNRREVGT